MHEDADSLPGRYQIVVIGREGAVLLDTVTGSSWSLARDVDTLQLGWRPLDQSWPGVVQHHASGLALPLPGEPLAETDAGRTSAAWWRPRSGSKWSRSRQAQPIIAPTPTSPDRNTP